VATFLAGVHTGQNLLNPWNHLLVTHYYPRINH